MGAKHWLTTRWEQRVHHIATIWWLARFLQPRSDSLSLWEIVINTWNKVDPQNQNSLLPWLYIWIVSAYLLHNLKKKTLSWSHISLASLACRMWDKLWLGSKYLACRGLFFIISCVKWAIGMLLIRTWILLILITLPVSKGHTAEKGSLIRANALLMAPFRNSAFPFPLNI